MESLVRDIRAYCLVEIDIEELQTIAWYQVTTSISDTAAVLRSPHGSRQSNIARSKCNSNIVTFKELPELSNTPGRDLSHGLVLGTVLCGLNTLPGKVDNILLE